MSIATYLPFSPTSQRSGSWSSTTSTSRPLAPSAARSLATPPCSRPPPQRASWPSSVRHERDSGPTGLEAGNHQLNRKSIIILGGFPLVAVGCCMQIVMVGAPFFPMPFPPPLLSESECTTVRSYFQNISEIRPLASVQYGPVRRTM